MVLHPIADAEILPWSAGASAGASSPGSEFDPHSGQQITSSGHPVYERARCEHVRGWTVRAAVSGLDKHAQGITDTSQGWTKSQRR